jgi:hypothetical protein
MAWLFFLLRICLVAGLERAKSVPLDSTRNGEVANHGCSQRTQLLAISPKELNGNDLHRETDSENWLRFIWIWLVLRKGKAGKSGCLKLIPSDCDTMESQFGADDLRKS